MPSQLGPEYRLSPLNIGAQASDGDVGPYCLPSQHGHEPTAGQQSWERDLYQHGYEATLRQQSLNRGNAMNRYLSSPFMPPKNESYNYAHQPQGPQSSLPAQYMPVNHNSNAHPYHPLNYINSLPGPGQTIRHPRNSSPVDNQLFLPTQKLTLPVTHPPQVPQDGENNFPQYDPTFNAYLSTPSSLTTPSRDSITNEFTIASPDDKSGINDLLAKYGPIPMTVVPKSNKKPLPVKRQKPWQARPPRKKPVRKAPLIPGAAKTNTTSPYNYAEQDFEMRDWDPKLPQDIRRVLQAINNNYSTNTAPARPVRIRIYHELRDLGLDGHFGSRGDILGQSELRNYSLAQLGMTPALWDYLDYKFGGRTGSEMMKKAGPKDKKRIVKTSDSDEEEVFKKTLKKVKVEENPRQPMKTRWLTEQEAQELIEFVDGKKS